MVHGVAARVTSATGDTGCFAACGQRTMLPPGTLTVFALPEQPSEHSVPRLSPPALTTPDAPEQACLFASPTKARARSRQFQRQDNHRRAWVIGPQIAATMSAYHTSQCSRVWRHFWERYAMSHMATNTGSRLLTACLVFFTPCQLRSTFRRHR